MKNTKKLIGAAAMLAAIGIALPAAYTLAFKDSVRLTLEDNAPTSGLLLDASRALKQKNVELARSKAGLRGFTRRHAQWLSKKAAVEEDIIKLESLISKGLKLFKYESSHSTYSKDELALDLDEKAGILRSLHSQRDSAVASLQAIKQQHRMAKDIINQSSAEVVRLESKLDQFRSKSQNFDLLRDLKKLIPDLGLMHSSTINSKLDLIDDRLHEQQILLESQASNDFGIIYQDDDYPVASPQVTIDIDEIEKLLNESQQP